MADLEVEIKSTGQRVAFAEGLGIALITGIIWRAVAQRSSVVEHVYGFRESRGGSVEYFFSNVQNKATINVL